MLILDRTKARQRFHCPGDALVTMLMNCSSVFLVFFFAFSASLLGLNVSAPLSDDNMTLLVSDKKNHDM